MSFLEGGYWSLLTDVRSFRDAVAVPKLLWMDLKEKMAELLLDHTRFGKLVTVEIYERCNRNTNIKVDIEMPERPSIPLIEAQPELLNQLITLIEHDRNWLGRAMISTLVQRWHLARARKLESGCYCCYHACDSKDCPPGFHDDDEEEAPRG